MKRIYLMLALMLSVIMSGCKPEIEEPTVVTKSVKEITDNSAKVVGQVVADGGAEVTERGICWSADGTPTILDYRVKDADGGLGTFTSNLSDLDANTTYYVRAYATNETGTSYGEEKSLTTEEVKTPETPEDPGQPETPEDPGQPENPNNHEYVDLGLPSGLKWATCNVGASKPEDYGNYYAWGEKSTKFSYTGDNSKTYGKQMYDIKGNSQYDAARANWGGTWRLPTQEELEELNNKCTWKWTTQNGVKGYKVIGPNGNSIFLPAAGYRDGSSLYNAGSEGYYWSSTPSEGNDYCHAYYLFFLSDYLDMFNYYRRYYGLTVRPVLE